MPFPFRTKKVFVSGMAAVALLLTTGAAAQTPQSYPPAEYPAQDPSAQAPQQQQQSSPNYPPPPADAQQPPSPAYAPPPNGPAGAQSPPPASPYPPPQAPLLAPQQLDQIVAPVALYPDPLLAQVLTAATFGGEIADAATWAVQHSYLKSDDLAAAIRADRLPFDASVQALLPFPQVLDYMARNIGWTQALGNAVLSQRPQVMDAVQRRRQQAYDYGYLRSNPYVRVDTPAPYDVEILPVNPTLYYVPAYDPFIVYVRPRPGILLGGAIHFGPAVTLGAPFGPWGWGGIGFGWRDHTILVGGRPWERSWANQRQFVTPYPLGRPRPGGRVERHDVHRH